MKTLGIDRLVARVFEARRHHFPVTGAYLAGALATLSCRAVAAELMPRACRRARFLAILQGKKHQLQARCSAAAAIRTVVVSEAHMG